MLKKFESSIQLTEGLKAAPSCELVLLPFSRLRIALSPLNKVNLLRKTELFVDTV